MQLEFLVIKQTESLRTCLSISNLQLVTVRKKKTVLEEEKVTSIDDKPEEPTAAAAASAETTTDGDDDHQQGPEPGAMVSLLSCLQVLQCQVDAVLRILTQLYAK